MSYAVRLETIAGHHPTAVVRRRAISRELARVVPEACGVVWAALRAMKVAGAGRHVALYLDDRINLEVGVEVAAPFEGHGEVIGSELPCGVVATVEHFGPYGQLHAAHRAILDWCADRARVRSAPGVELIQPLADKPWGMREFGVKSPDGHRIMVGQMIG